MSAVRKKKAAAHASEDTSKVTTDVTFDDTKTGARRRPKGATVAPFDIRAPNAAEADLEVAARQLTQQLCRGRALEVVIPTGNKELISAIAQTLNHAGRLYAIAGLQLLELKRRTPHGEFKAAVAALRIEPTQAKRLMLVAKFLAELPAAQAKAFINEPLNKVVPYARVGVEALTQATEAGEFSAEDLSTQTVADAQRESRKWRRLAEAGQAEAAQLRAAMAQPDGEAAWIERADAAQAELDEITAVISLRLEDLAQAAERWAETPPPKQVHGRRVNKYTARTRAGVGRLKTEFADAMAAVSAAAQKIEGRE